MAGGNAIGRGEFRRMMAGAVSMGALDLREAARAEAVLLDRLSTPDFGIRAAGLLGADVIAFVRSTEPGARNALKHAYLVVKVLGAHRSEWLLADVAGSARCGEVAAAWHRRGAALSFEDVPSPAACRVEEAVAAFMLGRLPWLGGLSGTTLREAPDYAVADVATFAAIVSRRGEAALERWLQDRLGADEFEYVTQAGHTTTTSTTADPALPTFAGGEGGCMPTSPR